MSLATNYISLRSLRVDLLINEPENDQFRPLVIRSQAEVLTTEGAIKNLEERTTVGSLGAKLTPQQIYTQLGNVTNLHTQVRNNLKTLYLNATNDDISA